MKLDQFTVNAFSGRQFGGNPAAVVPLASWLPEQLMQAIAAQNNLSETAFFVPEADGFGLRWFTPDVEVDLCGHATLATAHVLVNELGHTELPLRFNTRSGELLVQREASALSLDFPAYNIAEAPLDQALVSALGGSPFAAYSSAFELYLYESEAEVRALSPDMVGLKQASASAVIATAVGESVDFVSRFFGPQVGIDEDPVTGSAHCALVPLWAQRLGKTRLAALQVSTRGGELDCELQGGRVVMRGHARTFQRGQIELD